MILSKVGKPTKIKKVIYLCLSMILGLLLSFNLHALIEISYLNWAAEKGRVVIFYGSCALTPLLQMSIWLLGIVGGYLFGIFFWKQIYIKRVLEKIVKKSSRLR